MGVCQNIVEIGASRHATSQCSGPLIEIGPFLQKIIVEITPIRATATMKEIDAR